MLTNLIIRLVDFSRRFATLIILLAVATSFLLGGYVTTHFRMNTDVNQLLASGLSWRDREVELEKAFPQKVDRLVVVIDGNTADAAEHAAAALSEKMAALPTQFKNVTRPENVPFFRKNGLLFLSEAELNETLNALIQAQPMLGTMASDPSLRGLFGTLNLMLEGLQHGAMDYAAIAKPLDRIATSVEAGLSEQEVPLPWREMMSSEAPKPRDLRKFILTQPVLDYSALSPGAAASETVRALAKGLNLTPDHGVTVRLTGSVALNDEEFASVADGTTLATILSGVLVLAILFLALRSVRLVIPILLTLVVGLIATTAVAMATVGSLNLISVAFAVMFVGIAVDFGIQFGVRFRDQHHLEPDGTKAMLATAKIIALPLTLAAGSTALGFLTFLPTDYKGVAELGWIAGVGMIIAFILNVTLLPALLAIARPPAEPEEVGYSWAAPADGFLLKYRRHILICAGVAAVIGLVITTQLRFDFDPLNLKDPSTESVSTLFNLMEDPQANPYVIEILEPNLTAAQATAERLAIRPEISTVMTLANFVPEDQDKKLGFIGDANLLLGPTLNPATVAPPPSDDEIYATLQKTAAGLHALGEDRSAAARLAKALDEVIARHSHDLLDRLHRLIIKGMEAQLSLVRDMLSAERVTIDSISDDLRKDWITADGRAKVEVYPTGDARDYKVLTAFTAAVRSLAPTASGAPISIQESGKTVTDAFIQAGISALIAIALLVWLVLRNILDVIRLLTPLILAGILTLATMVIIRLPLNFANIIALPLLLSLGVSYAIYFVSYWRGGQTKPLQSSMARAVLFSASTTLVAFGTLSLSSHPGTAGMGELLTVALVYSLLCTFFILPALLGRPKVG